jgi:hypothetical protein
MGLLTGPGKVFSNSVHRAGSIASSGYDFELGQAELKDHYDNATFPAEVTAIYGSLRTLDYDAVADLYYLVNTGSANNIAKITPSGIDPLTIASYAVFQFYMVNAISSIGGGTQHYSNYAGAFTTTQSGNGERRRRLRLDSRSPNFLDQGDSADILPTFLVDTLYEVRFHGINNVQQVADFRNIGGDWNGSYIFTSPDGAYNGTPKAFFLASGKGGGTTGNVRVTSIGINLA